MKIDRFSGPYRFLSNFYPARVKFEDKVYPSVEHAFQAAKTHDPLVRETIRQASNAGTAKRIGRTIDLRPDWEDIKTHIMEDLIREKFSHSDFRKWLLDTGSAYLEEGNNWGDRFWGTVDGEGMNNLGKILMQVRKDLGGD